jgi:hypothetical protein
MITNRTGGSIDEMETELAGLRILRGLLVGYLSSGKGGKNMYAK